MSIVCYHSSILVVGNALRVLYKTSYNFLLWMYTLSGHITHLTGEQSAVTTFDPLNIIGLSKHGENHHLLNLLWVCLFTIPLYLMSLSLQLTWPSLLRWTWNEPDGNLRSDENIWTGLLTTIPRHSDS